MLRDQALPPILAGQARIALPFDSPKSLQPPILRREDFRDRLVKSPEGAKHTLTVLRDGQERTVTLELGRGL